MTRAITIFISSDDETKLNAYADTLADMVDEAMEAQEKAGEVPNGVVWDGVDVFDPDKEETPEAPATITPEIID